VVNAPSLADVKRKRAQAIHAYERWYAAEFAPKGDVVVPFPKVG
jgi:hypothetical protein